MQGEQLEDEGCIKRNRWMEASRVEEMETARGGDPEGE